MYTEALIYMCQAPKSKDFQETVCVCAAYVWTIQDARRATRAWKNSGRTLEELWKNSWKNSGRTLEELWKNSGRTPGRTHENGRTPGRTPGRTRGETLMGCPKLEELLEELFLTQKVVLEFFLSCFGVLPVLGSTMS
jgi:hypothetical protein